MQGSLAPFFALLALPLVAALLPQLNAIVLFKKRLSLAPALVVSAQTAVWLAAGVAAILLLPVNIEFTLGSWLPVSVSGAPLILSSHSDALLVVLAVLLVQLQQSARRGLRVIDALVIIAVTLLGFANNLPALIIGVGLVDIAAAIDMGDDPDPAARTRQVVLCGFSILLLLVAVIIHLSAQNSLWFPLLQLGGQSVSLITFAVIIRFLALVTTPAIGRAQLHHVATFLLAARLFELGTPEVRLMWVAYALILALTKLLVAWLAEPDGHVQVLRQIATGACALAACSLAFGNPQRIVLAGIGWLLGVALLAAGLPPSSETQPAPSARLIRLLSSIAGTLALISFPFTATFAGSAGLVSWLSAQSAFGTLLAAVWVLALTLMTACCLRFVFQPSVPNSSADDTNPQTQAALPGALWPTLGLTLSGLVLLFAIGVVGTTANAVRPVLGLMMLSDWLLWLLALVLGGLLWWQEARIIGRLDRPLFTRTGNTTIRSQLAGVIGLNGLGELVADSVLALGRPLSGVFSFLESDGALIWGVIAVLIALLVTRTTGP